MFPKDCFCLLCQTLYLGRHIVHWVVFIIFYWSFTLLSHGEQSRWSRWSVICAGRSSSEVKLLSCPSVAGLQCVLDVLLLSFHRFSLKDLKVTCLGMFHILFCCPYFSIMELLLPSVQSSGTALSFHSNVNIRPSNSNKPNHQFTLGKFSFKQLYKANTINPCSYEYSF